MEPGHLSLWGIKQQTNSWGGAPLALGSGNGVEIESDSIDPGVELVKSAGVRGSAWRWEHQAVLGSKRPAGDLVAPLYYQDALWSALAQVIGADAVTNITTGVERHDMTLQASRAGKHFTIAEFGADRVRELNTAKILGFRIELTEGQVARVTLRVASHDLHINDAGALGADDDFVSVSAAIADGAITIAAAASAAVGFDPSPLYMTKVAGVTDLDVTLNVELWDGTLKTITFSETDFTSEVWTGTDYVRRVISGTIAGSAGTGNVKIGITRGVNKVASASSVTLASTRDLVHFGHTKVYMLPQVDTTAFADADAIPVSSCTIEVDTSADSRVTTKYGRHIEEPATGGTDFLRVMFGFNFSAETSAEQEWLIGNQHKKLSYRVLVDAQGPQIGSTAYPNRLKVWLNGIRFERGFSQLSGPGQRTLDFGGDAQAVSAVSGSDWPSGKTQPIYLQLWNGLATAYLS